MPGKPNTDAIAAAVAEELRSGTSPADAIARVAEMLGVSDAEVGAVVNPMLDKVAREAAASALADVQRVAEALLAAEFAKLVREGAVSDAFSRLANDLYSDNERTSERAAAAIRNLALRLAFLRKKAETKGGGGSDLSVVAEVLDEVS